MLEVELSPKFQAYELVPELILELFKKEKRLFLTHWSESLTEKRATGISNTETFLEVESVQF